MKLDLAYDSLLVMCVLTSNEAPSPSGVEGSPIVIIDTNDRWNYDTARMEITPPLLSCSAVTATAAAIVLDSHNGSRRAMKATVISVTRVTSRNLVLARLSP